MLGQKTFPLQIFKITQQTIVRNNINSYSIWEFTHLIYYARDNLLNTMLIILILCAWWYAMQLKVIIQVDILHINQGFQVMGSGVWEFLFNSSPPSHVAFQ